jgi:hypothetical protein
VFTLKHLGGDSAACRQAIAKAAAWALRCRNEDGGFGHYPGSPSDADAVYFQVGTLVMAGFLRPANVPLRDAALLGWGHLMPVRGSASRRKRLRGPRGRPVLNRTLKVGPLTKKLFANIPDKRVQSAPI